ncbi:hypothetical protein LSAT2_017767 [Lamellibrachia satsuma]|nr:hypothetical protein LSAT2_017767 [Lamellibrachia satsuma]
MYWYQHYATPQCVVTPVGQTEVHRQRGMDSGTRPFDVAGVSALATAICYMSMVTFLGRLTRSLASQCPARLRPYVFDLVTTFQLMAYSLELGHIRGFAGDVGFTIALVCIPFWAELTIAHGSADPCHYLMVYTQGMMGIRKMLARIACQLLGGLLSYQFARLFWSLGLSDGHAQRLTRTQCVSDLKVPLVAGFAIEFLGTISLILLAKATSTCRLPGLHLARYIAAAAVVLVGVDFTGMYLNPINATNQTFGCHGTGRLEHLVVYWGAPFAATVCACVTQRHLCDVWKTMAAEDRSKSNGIYQNNNSVALDSILKTVANKHVRKRSKTGKMDEWSMGGTTSTRTTDVTLVTPCAR